MRLFLFSLLCFSFVFRARTHTHVHTQKQICVNAHKHTAQSLCGSKRGSETYFSLLDDTNKTMQRIRQRRQLICFVLRIYCIGHGGGGGRGTFLEGGLEVGLALCLRPQRAYILFVHSLQRLATIRVKHNFHI